MVVHGSTHAQPLSSLAAGLDPFGETCVPGGAQLGNCELEQPLDRQRLAADLADHHKAR